MTDEINIEKCRRGDNKRLQPDLPLITIITVVRNDPQGLEKTLVSAQEQTYENIETIVIDGASDSDTLDVIHRHENQIDTWVSEPDNGIYDAMNKGVRLANGEWIHFLNAGDVFYTPDTVRQVFSQDYGDADFIYGHTFFAGGDYRGVVKAWEFDQLWKTMIFTHQSLFTRAAVLKERPFDARFKICADYNLIFNAYMQGLKFYNSDTVIAVFDPGMSDVNRALMAIEKWKIVRRYRNDIRFHLFYLQLVLKRSFHDLWKRRQRRLAAQR